MKISINDILMVSCPASGPVRNTPGAIISSRGEGRVVSFADNPKFRGFWYGSSKLCLNAIFFGPTISSYSTR